MAETLVSSQGAAVKNGLVDKAMGFFNGVTKEMRKVTWPKRAELQEATIVVLVVCVIMSAFVFGVDKIFEIVLKLIYSL